MEKEIKLIDIKRADQEGPECSEEILREIRRENRKREELKNVAAVLAYVAGITSALCTGIMIGRCLTFLTAMGF